MGVNKAVIDANVLLALVDKKDKWHYKSKEIAKALEEKDWEIVFLDCIMNEVISVLGKRLVERKEADKFEGIVQNLEKFVPENKIEWLYPEIPDFYSDIINLTKEKRGRLNFHDALIALFIRSSGLKYIVSFDTDFDDIDWCVRLKDEKDIP